MHKLVAFTVALCLVSLTNASPVQATAGKDAQDQRAIIEFVRAHVTIDLEGMFVIDAQVAGKDRELLRSIFAPLNDNLASVDPHLRPTVQHRASKGPGLAAPWPAGAATSRSARIKRSPGTSSSSVEPSRSLGCSSTRRFSACQPGRYSAPPGSA